MPTIDELRERISRACEEAQRRGLRIAAEKWGIRYVDGLADPTGDCLCPLGAVAVCENAPDVAMEGTSLYRGCDLHEHEIVVARHLGVSSDWADSFVAGVDCGSRDDAEDVDAYDLGAEFRARYVTP
jgi:hypothetical protein